MSALAAAGLAAGACSAPGHRAAPPPGPPSSTATTSTTEAMPVYAPSPYSWTRATSAALALGGGAGSTLSAVLAPQLTGTWTIAGTRFSASGAPTAMVWTSADARTWKATPLVPPPGLARAVGAAQYHGATTVVGSVGETGNQQAAAWYSPTAGAPFMAADVPLTGGASSMAHVAVGALGTFASGSADGRFALWSSSDGRHWNELTDAEKVITALPGAQVDALLAVGDSVYAAGSVRRGPWREAALWASTDGLHWRMVTTAASAFSGSGDRVIYALAPFETGLVAVGGINLGSGWVPASWISPDGLSWSQPATDFPGATPPSAPATATPAPPATATATARATAAVYGVAGGAAVRSVAAITTLAGSSALVATGGGPYGQGAWQSTDGMHWVPLGLPGPAAAAGAWRPGLAAATTDTTVLVDSDAGRPYVLVHGPAGWAQPSADPAVFGPVRPDARPVTLSRSAAALVLQVQQTSYPQSIGPPSSHTVTLTSTDGRTWSARPVPGAYPATLPAPGVVTIRVPGRWVAAGPGSARRASTWISPTGTAWTAEGFLDHSAPGPTGGSAPHPASPVTAAAASTPATVAGLCATPTATAAAPTNSSTTASSPAPSTPTSAPTATAPTAGSSATTAPATSTSATSTSATPTSATTASATTPSENTPSTTAPGAGAAAGHQAVVAVGSVAVAGPAPSASAPIGTAVTVGRAAAAWVSAAGTHWHRATVANPGPAGSFAAMAGCVATASGLVAYGTAPTPSGAPAPGLWRSPDGSTWTAQSVSAFGADTPNPLIALATDGSSWLAAADPDPSAAPAAGRVAPAPGVINGPAGAPVGPAAALDSDSLVGPGPVGGSTGSGLWLSSDAGATWQLVDTQVAPWSGSEEASVDAVGFAGNRPVVAGAVDGQLAVWTGTPAAAGPRAG